MFFNKKGEFKKIQIIITILLVGAIVILTSYALTKGISRGTDILSCKRWVTSESALKVPLLGIDIKDMKNTCVTFQDELKGSKEEAYETIAKGMHDTWKMYGEGKIDFFSGWDWGIKNTYCFMGDEITKNEKLKLNYLDVEEFEEYLSNNRPPKSEQTYGEFFAGAKNTKIDFGDIKRINLEDNNKIYILFTIQKQRRAWNTKEAIIFGGGGCLKGAEVGSIVGLLVGIFGGGVGSIPGAAIGSGIGCAIGMASTLTVSLAGQAQEVYPGLIMISEDISTLKEKCDGDIYYNPKIKKN